MLFELFFFRVLLYLNIVFFFKLDLMFSIWKKNAVNFSYSDSNGSWSWLDNEIYYHKKSVSTIVCRMVWLKICLLHCIVNKNDLHDHPFTRCFNFWHWQTMMLMNNLLRIKYERFRPLKPRPTISEEASSRTRACVQSFCIRQIPYTRCSNWNCTSISSSVLIQNMILFLSLSLSLSIGSGVRLIVYSRCPKIVMFIFILIRTVRY